MEDKYDGVSTDIDFTGSNTMRDYRTGIRANYAIDKGRVYVDMNREGNHRYYSGKIEIAYEVRKANGEDEVVSQEFSSGWGDDNQYNVWARFGGKPGFHAFFSDSWKGVILVINEITDLNTERTDVVNVGNRQLGSGSVWFKSFRSLVGNNYRDCYEGGTHVRMPPYPEGPQKRCWFVSTGLWNCQAWEDGNKVRTFMALEPRNSCYKKLGDFRDLNINEAFDADDGDIYIAQ